MAHAGEMARAGEDGRKLPRLSPGEVFAGRYRIEKALGRGLLGELYQVKHLKYGQNLALKVYYPGTVLTENDRQSFKSEFDRLKQLKHPGVVRYFEQGDWPEANTKYCTMEFINGSNLRTLIDELKGQGTQIASQDALQLVLKLLETLQAVHAAGVSHRNIKPEEVLVVAKGRARSNVQWDLRLSDFALAGAPADWITEVPHEKLPYMSPEVRGYGEAINERADLYSVGALLYELLTGFAWDESTPATSRKSALPRKLDDVMELCLAANPNDRYASAGAMMSALEDLALHPWEEASSSGSRLTPVFIIAGVLALAAVIAAIFLKQPEQPDVTPQQQWASMRQKVSSDPNFLKETPEQTAELAAREKDMIYIPAGTYISGTLPGETDARPAEPPAFYNNQIRAVEIVGFYIDRYEHPNQPGKLPVTGQSFDEAQKLCNDQGKRLCTAQEWERACKGTDSLIYAYGDVYDESKCPPLGQSGKVAIDAHPSCVSGFGVVNMSGGVPEWTYSAIESGPAYRIVKGGEIGSERWGTRCASIKDEGVGLKDPNLGFRCCK